MPIQLSRLGNKPIKPTKPAYPPEPIKPADQPSAPQNLKPGRLVDKSAVEVSVDDPNADTEWCALTYRLIS
jgi:hypothetical protein